MLDTILVFMSCLFAIMVIAILLIYFIYKNEDRKDKKLKEERKMKRFLMKYNEHVRKNS